MARIPTKSIAPKVVKAKLAEHDGALDAVEIKTKYMWAYLKPTIHMEVDFEGLLTAGALAGGALHAAANTRAELLRTVLLRHMAGVGTMFVDGEHKAAETTIATTLTAIPAAVDFNSCKVLARGILVAIVGHGDSAGKHFDDDTGAGGTGATVTTDPPTTVAELVVDLNDLRQAMLTHFSAGSQ